MTHEEAKKLGATHSRGLLFFKSYYKSSGCGFWVLHKNGHFYPKFNTLSIFMMEL